MIFFEDWYDLSIQNVIVMDQVFLFTPKKTRSKIDLKSRRYSYSWEELCHPLPYPQTKKSFL